MPIRIDPITIQGLYRRVGRQVHPTGDFSFQDPALAPQRVKGNATGNVGVCLYWPRKGHGYLTINAYYGPPTRDDPNGKPFLTGLDAYQRCYRQFGSQPQAQADFAKEYHVLSAIVPLTAPLRFVIEVDTDHGEFIQAAQNLIPAEGGISVFLRTDMFDDRYEEPADEDPARHARNYIRLRLEPLVQPEPYRGYVALDLGNNSTALALHPLARRLATQHVAFIDVDPKTDLGRLTPRAASTDSAVRITHAEKRLLRENLMAHPRCFRWKIGAPVWETRGIDGVALGAKRRLADRDGGVLEPFHVLPSLAAGDNAPREEVRLPATLAGELLMCRFIQRFREAQRSSPTKVAFTYPTTYFGSEIKRLRTALVQALRRARAADPAEPASRDDALLDLQLDEASAGAFYYLFRDFIGQHGGLLRLRAFYPNGYNALIFDCGGGTTDISLVRANVDPNRRDGLCVRVLARSGRRNFGGDEITLAVVRLLKAQIAMKRLDPDARAPRRLPADGLASFLEQHGSDFDELVPTRFQPARMNQEDRRHAALARRLWSIAEDIKHRMADTPDATGKVRRDESPAAFDEKQSFADPDWDFLRVGGAVPAELIEELRKIRIERKQVDVLVRPQIERAVDCCNRLIRRRLLEESPSGFPEEVHRVIVLGNAARYPTVLDTMRSRLHVLSFDRRLAFDEGALKSAVAQGAVLALAVKNDPAIDVDFDWRLSKRLPFTVGYRHLGIGRPVRLFAENELYEDLKEQCINVHPAKGNEDAAGRTGAIVVKLERLWPGDEEDPARQAERERVAAGSAGDSWEPFLNFLFEHGVRGAVKIAYDPEREDFVAEDEAGNPGKLSDPNNKDIYRAPAQRGDW